MWLLALVLVVFSARYFLNAPPLLRPSLPGLPSGPTTDVALDVAPYLYASHRLLFLTHIAAGIVAITLGLFQFIAALRNARPRVHRLTGTTYVAAVALGSVTGFPLSFFILDAVPASLHAQFYPVVLAFASLAIVWPSVTWVAFVRARERRFELHREWMIRSYSLTFAAVTTRLIGTAIILLTGAVLLSVQISIMCWPLNLVAAQWLIRRTRAEPVLATAPST